MLKEFIEFLQNQKKEPVISVDGRNYNVLLNNSLAPIREPERETIKLSSLTSLVSYIKSGDGFECELVTVVVNSSREVVVKSKLFGDWKQMETIAIAEKEFIDQFNFYGKYYSIEEFKIKLMTCFKESQDSKKIISLISKVIDSNLRNIDDDGITQSITIKSGITMIGDEKLPPIVTLIPYCTFSEVEQPVRKFLLRGKKSGEELQYAIFEADGREWEYRAREEIKKYLQDNLEDVLIMA